MSSIYLIPAIFNWLTYGTVAYLGKIWNILPLVNCILFITILVFKLLIADRIELIIKNVKFDANANVFDDIYTVMYMIKLMKAINGVNAIVLILNIFRYFEAHQKLAIFISGVQHALWDMILFLPTILGFTILGYAIAFHLSFGDRIRVFKSIPSSVYTLVTLLIGDANGFAEMYDEGGQVGISLYVSYIMIVVIILGTTFFSIVDAAYHHAKGKKEFGDAIDYLSEDFADTFKILGMCCFCPCRKLEICCQNTIGKRLRKLRKIEAFQDSEGHSAPEDTKGSAEQGASSKKSKANLLNKISRVMPMKGRYNINPKRANQSGNQIEMLFSRLRQENKAMNEHLLHEIRSLLEHHGRGFRVRGDSSEYDSSEFSADDIDDFEDEFDGNNLRTEGHAGRRKELKRLRAGETKRAEGPRIKKVHDQDNEYDDYDVVTHHDEHV